MSANSSVLDIPYAFNTQINSSVWWTTDGKVIEYNLLNQNIIQHENENIPIQFPDGWGSFIYCNNNTHIFWILNGQIESYNTLTNEWIPSGQYVDNIRYYTCQLYKQIMYVFGGKSCTYGASSTICFPSNRIYKYSSDLNIVRPLNTTLIAPWFWLSSIRKQECIYLFTDAISWNMESSLSVQVFNATDETIFTVPWVLKTGDFYLPFLDTRTQKIFIVTPDGIHSYEEQIMFFDFKLMETQTLNPGESIVVSDYFEINSCSPDAYHNFFISSNATIEILSVDSLFSIHHFIHIQNGICNKICTLYEVCSDCMNEMIPLIPTAANTTQIQLQLISNNVNIKLLTEYIMINIGSCPIGEGFDPQSLVLDCNKCIASRFKIIYGNYECFSCDINENRFECNGHSEIIILYNHWFWGYNQDNNQLISPFDVRQDYNHSIFATNCAPRYCCMQPFGCNYLESFIVADEINNIFTYSNVNGELCAKYRNYSSPLCSRCIDGYFEMYGTTQCGKCNNYENLVWIVPIVILSTIFISYIFISSRPIRKKNYLQNEVNYKQLLISDELNLLSLLIFKIFVYYYQSLSVIFSTQSISNLFTPIVAIFDMTLEWNSNINSNSDNFTFFCIIPFMTNPLIKMITSSMFVIFSFIMFIVFCIGFIYGKKYSFFQCLKRTNKQRNPNITVAFLKLIIISSGTLLNLLFKLLSCTEVTKKTPGID
eukprot:289579_1